MYGEAVIYERHRHRYEVNNLLRKRLTNAAGIGGELRISGTSPDDRLVEVIELSEHPFFVASQFHPEFKSRPERPAPLFRDFIAAALARAQAREALSGEAPGPARTRLTRSAPTQDGEDVRVQDARTAAGRAPDQSTSRP
jgi:CTP synthase